MQSIDTKTMLRTAEAAEYLTLGASTLEKLRASGGGPIYYKVGKSVVYHPEDLDAWLSSKRRRSTSVES